MCLNNMQCMQPSLIGYEEVSFRGCSLNGTLSPPETACGQDVSQHLERCSVCSGKMLYIYCGESLDVMREVADVLPCLRRTQQSVASQVSGKASIPEVAFS